MTLPNTAWCRLKSVSYQRAIFNPYDSFVLRENIIV